MTAQRNTKAATAAKQVFTGDREEPKYIYNAGTNRYRNTRTGRFISHNSMIELRDEFIDRQKVKVSKLAGKLAKKDISRFEWTLQMRKQIHDTFVGEYLAGSGGVGNFTDQDRKKLQGIIGKQYKRLENFEVEMKLKGSSVETAMSEAQVSYRSGLYMESSSQSFSEGMSASRGITFPQNPGDGSTRCMANCRCDWYPIEKVEGGYNCTWKLEPAEHCSDCVGRSNRWAPLFIPTE